jgi:UDPglucose 6-dehydrogenase
MKNVAVIGSGYVGLVTGTCFAETGNNVICVDNNSDKVEMLRNGEVPIYEPHLENIFSRNIREGRLTFTTSLKDAVDIADIIFLALPTPPNEGGSADLKYVLAVAEQLGKIMTSFKVIVNKSTVPVGTAEKVSAVIKAQTSIDFAVVSNPEFLREGFAIDDFLNPDRVVIGSTHPRAIELLEELYKPFIKDGNRMIVMDEKSAELTKYAANSFLASKITFMNEIANFCEIVGADVDMVRKGIGSDARIGHRFLYPGIGFGGSCFPKDVQALVNSGKEENFDFKIIQSVLDVNFAQKRILFEKALNYFGDLKGKRFALWGLAFKPDTDDVREASSFALIDLLLDAGASVCAYDPEAIENTRSLYGDKIEYASSHYNALQNADALFVVTEWMTFKNVDFQIMSDLLKSPIIFDGRNLFDLELMEKQLFYYNSIGRKTIFPNKIN